MTSREVISIVLVLQLVVSSVLGPGALCLCAEGCVQDEVDLLGDVVCCVTDDCCPDDCDEVAAPEGRSCECCLTIEGDASPKLTSTPTDFQRFKAAPMGFVVSEVVVQPAVADRPRDARKESATGPPSEVAHLRTIRLLL